MRVLINGESRETGVRTLAELVRELGLDRTRIAAELNLNLVRKADYDSTLLKEGDRVEIVTLVGGG